MGLRTGSSNDFLLFRLDRFWISGSCICTSISPSLSTKSSAGNFLWRVSLEFRLSRRLLFWPGLEIFERSIWLSGDRSLPDFLLRWPFLPSMSAWGTLHAGSFDVGCGYNRIACIWSSPLDWLNDALFAPISGNSCLIQCSKASSGFTWSIRYCCSVFACSYSFHGISNRNGSRCL